MERSLAIATLFFLSACGSFHSEISRNHFRVVTPPDWGAMFAEAFRACPEGFEYDQEGTDGVFPRLITRVLCINETRAVVRDGD